MIRVINLLWLTTQRLKGRFSNCHYSFTGCWTQQSGKVSGIPAQGKTSRPSLSCRNWVLRAEGASQGPRHTAGKRNTEHRNQVPDTLHKVSRFSLKKLLGSWQYFFTIGHLRPKIVQVRSENRLVAQQHSNYLTSKHETILISSATERKKGMCVWEGGRG